MDGVKVMGLELLGTGLAFPSLEILSFEDMQGWEVWSTISGDVGAVFPRLQQLSLVGCPNLVKVSLEALPSLRTLRISGCGHDVLTSLVHVASSVTMLDIRHISQLNDRLWRGVIEHLGAVKEIRVIGCNEIRYLWESEAEASKVFVNLRKLVVQDCLNLVSLGEKEEDDCGSNLTSLRSLFLTLCNNLEHCSCPNSIESLDIRYCESMTSVSFPTGGGRNLKSLVIEGCKKLLDMELGGGEKTGTLINSSMRMLESVDINYWPNLKLMVKLSYFIHMTRLSITDCPNLESFPDHELPNLTLLKSLTITYCESMDASFPSGLWPPNLLFLTIGVLKKPVSKWGQQHFPTSLDDVELMGGGSEDVSNFSKLSHLFPSSITSLKLSRFEKLESVSIGLQHLTFLQHLDIDNCPKMTDLPEMLLPLLLSLKIRGCPNLKERSSERGSYWPLISRIPCSQGRS